MIKGFYSLSALSIGHREYYPSESRGKGVQGSHNFSRRTCAEQAVSQGWARCKAGTRHDGRDSFSLSSFASKNRIRSRKPPPSKTSIHPSFLLSAKRNSLAQIGIPSRIERGKRSDDVYSFRSGSDGIHNHNSRISHQQSLLDQQAFPLFGED